MKKDRTSSRSLASCALLTTFALGTLAPVFVPPLMAQTEGRTTEDPLTVAINKNDLAAVRTLLEADPKLANATGRSGYSPLSRAVSSGKVDMVQLLLEKGADPNVEQYGNSLIATALTSYSENWREIAAALVEKGAKVDGLDSEGNTLLHRVINYGSGNSRERVQWLLEKGADANRRNRQGKSPLEIAISGGNTDVVRVLVDKVGVKGRDPQGNSLLHLAMSRGGQELMRMLLEKGADVNAANAAGETPLHLAASSSITTIKFLLDNGANANLRNNRGDIPLHVALRRTDPRPFRGIHFEESAVSSSIPVPGTPRGTLLAPLTEKSNIDLKDQFGFSPLMLAVVNRDQETRDLIMERAPKMDSTTKLFDAVAQGNMAELTPLLTLKPFLVYFRLPDGTTPLHTAALWGTLGAAQLLVQKGADVNARDARGETPLHETMTNPTGLFLRRSKNMAAFLLGKGADANALDVADTSPLHAAVKSGEVELIQALLDKGARVNDRDSTGNSPLMLVANRTGSLAIAQLLLTKGADPNLRDRSNGTALTRAVAAKRLDLTRSLLEKGAEVSNISGEGRGLLGSVISGSFGSLDDTSRDIVALLLEKGADPNERSYGESLVARLVQNSGQPAVDILKLLLATKKISLKSSDGRNLLLQAVIYGRKEMVEALIDGGADVNEKDSQGRSVLKNAQSRGASTAVIDLLKARGATE